MEVEQEIKKENDKDRASNRGRKGILRNRTGTMTKRPFKPRPPTKKAIKAAVTAMTSAGFKVPDGMKVVINLEKEGRDTSKLAPSGKKNNSNNNNNINRRNNNNGNNKGGSQQKNQSNRDHPNKSNGGRLWGKKK